MKRPGFLHSGLFLAVSELFKHWQSCLSTKGQVVLSSSPTQSPFIRLCRRLSPTSPGAVCFCSLMLITPDWSWKGGVAAVGCQPAQEGSSRERSRMRGRREQGWHCGPGHCSAGIPEGLYGTCSTSAEPCIEGFMYIYLTLTTTLTGRNVLHPILQTRKLNPGGSLLIPLILRGAHQIRVKPYFRIK